MDGNYDKTADFSSTGDFGPVEFLQAITGGGPVNIVAITPDAPKGTGVQGWTGRVDTHGATIAAMPAKAGPRGRNLHFALNEPRAGLIGQMGKWAEDDFAFPARRRGGPGPVRESGARTGWLRTRARAAAEPGDRLHL